MASTDARRWTSRDEALDQVHALAALAIAVTELRVDLAQLEASQRQIVATLSQLVPVSPLSRADRLRLVQLLPALRATFGAVPFLARDVKDAAAFRPVCAALSTKSLGRLFARATGVVLGGLWMERVGEEGHVALWRVGTVGVSGLFDPQKAA